MIRHLMTLICFTAFMGGLSWAESENPVQVKKQLRVPQQVADARVTRGGDMLLVTLADLRNSCESFDGYVVEIQNRELIIDSFINKRQNVMCAEVYQDGLRRDYAIRGLNPALTYRILFREADGGLVDFGVTEPDPEGM